MKQDIIVNRIDSFKKKYVNFKDKTDYHVFTLLCMKYFFFCEDNAKFDEDEVIDYLTDGANDGGIDFVMKPLGRFFQVTETLDFKKYFLDIDKIQRYPITFVIKTEIDEENIYTQLKENALSSYGVKAIVQRYMDSIEEVINIPKLMQIFLNQIERKKVKEIMDEIVIQSRVEFNYDD